MRTAEPGLPERSVMRKSASANCRRRANQRASQRIIILFHGTILTDHGANKELKGGSLAPPLPTRAARRQHFLSFDNHFTPGGMVGSAKGHVKENPIVIGLQKGMEMSPGVLPISGPPMGEPTEHFSKTGVPPVSVCIRHWGVRQEFVAYPLPTAHGARPAWAMTGQ